MISQTGYQSEAIKNEAQKHMKYGGIKQYWTQHRVTLIAFELKFVSEQKPQLNIQELDEDELVEQTEKRRRNKNKIDLRYQSGFLSISQQQTSDIDVQMLTKQYEHLNWLFTSKINPNFMAVRQFVKMMLELKHSVIVNQFAELYNQILKYLKMVTFDQVFKEEQRFNFIQTTKEKIIDYAEKHQSLFPIYISYLNSMPIETKKFISVQVYCFLAELFNFNINQYYCQAFALIGKNKGSKKVKKQL